MLNSFYSKEELNNIGFQKVGTNVLISRKASIYSPKYISLGNNVRIDDFCVLSGKIDIKDFVHIACFCCLFGGDEGIYIGNYTTLSSRISVYAKTDDYSGEFMVNPMIPKEYTNIISKKVFIGDNVIIGTGSVILPGVNIHDGVACGALTLVNRDLESWSINVGIPVRKSKNRSKKLLNLETEFLDKLLIK
ncbi:dTDP-4-amino-4,6-dideoxy-D-glucose acyltransferase [Clostridium homopropionicum DSM 5847]|uniref:dTDP-4-amino-4,6-dideoxy-D-glucose acyltransferase n=1 Tax=Clostridium homopropionicum DSM 5847 TaxID=1121318 RepID=A0A0L6ZEG8_9CLOT|nr:acyltransferase [Clostridium homopropionicum]KOA21342.1 dTDP-4-amino-4,6-dideoxy-D-glucose acyltransferase [Clostridium homopropionicum DSM 5847]SFG98140.1 galactoside O-acetyltransferase [Clostridium homopropionicum]